MVRGSNQANKMAKCEVVNSHTLSQEQSDRLLSVLPQPFSRLAGAITLQSIAGLSVAMAAVV